MINSIQSVKYTTNRISFRSNREHEAMLRALREAQAVEMKRIFARLNELHNYQINDKGCLNMEKFFLNFVC